MEGWRESVTREEEDYWKIDILSHLGYEVSLSFLKFKWFGIICECVFRGTTLKRESKNTETLMGRCPICHF